jgi:c-di-GMP-binding flagellar brake protein YcgR
VPRDRILSPFSIVFRAIIFQSPLEDIMNSVDRRNDPRVNACVPVRFRVLDQPDMAEQKAESQNMSQHGIYFVTSAPLQIGMPMELTLRIPHDLGQRISSEVVCVGRVVRVQPVDKGEGMLGVGIHIDRFETKLQVQERWAS